MGHGEGFAALTLRSRQSLSLSDSGANRRARWLTLALDFDAVTMQIPGEADTRVLVGAALERSGAKGY